MAIRVAQPAGVLLEYGVEAGAKLDIVEVGRERAPLVVVVAFASGEHSVPNTEIEDTGIAAASTTLKSRDVGDAVPVHEELHDGAIDNQRIEIPFSLQNRDNANAHMDMLNLQ